MTIRPRRSVLYMPGSNARAIEKARTLAADAVILDLEDSVAPDAKGAARDQVMAAVTARGFGLREVVVRINGIDTPWHADDLTAAAHAAPDAVLVPKISTPEQIEMIGQRLLDMRTDHRTRLWAMIETPIALFRILALAAKAKDSELRLEALVMGTYISAATRVKRCGAISTSPSSCSRSSASRTGVRLSPATRTARCRAAAPQGRACRPRSRRTAPRTPCRAAGGGRPPRRSGNWHVRCQ